MGKTWRAWAAWEYRLARCMLALGADWEKIADLLGRTKQAVQTACHYQGIKMPSETRCRKNRGGGGTHKTQWRAWHEWEYDIVRRILAKGGKWPQVAKALNRSEKSVQAACCRIGITLPPDTVSRTHSEGRVGVNPFSVAPTQTREKVLCLRQQGKKYREIAVELGLRVDMVGGIISKAKRKAKKATQ